MFLDVYLIKLHFLEMALHNNNSLYTTVAVSYLFLLKLLGFLHWHRTWLGKLCPAENFWQVLVLVKLERLQFFGNFFLCRRHLDSQ